MFGFNKKKKPGKLYFALVVADQPLDDAKFSVDKDCTFFVTAGETLPKVVIPGTVLKEIVERFQTKEVPSPAEGLGGKVRITEKRT